MKTGSYLTLVDGALVPGCRIHKCRLIDRQCPQCRPRVVGVSQFEVLRDLDLNDPVNQFALDPGACPECGYHLHAPTCSQVSMSPVAAMLAAEKALA